MNFLVTMIAGVSLAVAAVFVGLAHSQNVQTTQRAYTSQQTVQAQELQPTTNGQNVQAAEGQAEDYCILQCSAKVQ